MTACNNNNTIDLESLENKENSDTVPEVLNTTNRESERAVLAETTMDTNNLPAPDESRFPLTSTDQIQETIKEAQNKNTKRSTNTWMRVWYSWAKSRQVNESIETMAPATLDGVLQKFYLEVRKQDGSEYEPDSLKVMQAALERYLSTQKYPYSLIGSLEFSSSTAVQSKTSTEAEFLISLERLFQYLEVVKGKAGCAVKVPH